MQRRIVETVCRFLCVRRAMRGRCPRAPSRGDLAPAPHASRASARLAEVSTVGVGTFGAREQIAFSGPNAPLFCVAFDTGIGIE